MFANPVTNSSIAFTPISGGKIAANLLVTSFISIGVVSWASFLAKNGLLVGGVEGGGCFLPYLPTAELLALLP